MTNVNVVIGAGSIGQAIVRRVSADKQVLLADLRLENAGAAAKTLSEAGFNVAITMVDVSSRASVDALVKTAMGLGNVSGLIHAAGVSPSQASSETILKVGSLRNRAGAGAIRQGYCPRGRWRRDRLPVRAPPAATLGRAKCGSRHDAGGRVARSADAQVRSDKELTSRLPDFKTRELVARDGRGSSLGKAQREGQHDQSRDYYHATCEGRTDVAARRGLPAYDRSVCGGASRNPGRGRSRRRTPDGP
jgi:short chain dehydrogenase